MNSYSFEGTRRQGLGFGLGLRVPHYSYILEHRPQVDWFEAITENYLPTAGGPLDNKPLRILEKIRADYPLVLHGVSLSIGSVDPLNLDYLRKAKALYDRISPAWVSDHLCWTGVEGENLHDLLPLPYTEEAIAHVANRVMRVQDFLEKILLENVSSYVEFSHSRMPEWEFLSAIASRADCGILLDINNIYVSHRNHGFNPHDFLNGIPVDRVGQFHLAGHSDHSEYVIDTHDHEVREEVWDLYRAAVQRFGNVSTLLERDDHIPPFPELYEELQKAKAYAKGTDPSRDSKLDAVGDCRPARDRSGTERPDARP